MNKEQFKKSISEMINHFAGGMIEVNLKADAAMREGNESIVTMLQGQAQGLAAGFEQGLDQLIEEMLPDEKDEKVESVDEN